VQACESTDELAEELRLIALATADTPEAGLLFRNVMLSSLDWYAIASNLRHAPRVAQRPVVQQTTAATQEPRRPDLRPVGADGTVGVRRAGRSGSGTDPLAGDPGAPF
jgi:hypothetical protein